MSNLFDGILSENLFAVTGKIVGVCLIFCTVFILISLVYHVAKNITSSGGKKTLELKFLTRAFSISIMLACYIPVATATFYLMDVVVKATELSETEWHLISDKNNSFIRSLTEFEEPKTLMVDTETGETKEVDAGFWEKTKSYVKQGVDKIGHAIAFSKIQSLAGITSVVLLLLGLIIQSLIRGLVYLFFIIGPFAVVVSILPMFEGRLVAWYKTYLTVLFSGVVYNLINYVYLAMYLNAVDGIGGGIGVLGTDTNLFKFFADSVGVIIMYLLPFWISGKIFGSESAGRFLSQTMQTALLLSGYGGRLLAMKAGIGAQSLGNSLGKVAGNKAAKSNNKTESWD